MSARPGGDGEDRGAGGEEGEAPVRNASCSAEAASRPTASYRLVLRKEEIDKARKVAHSHTRTPGNPNTHTHGRRLRDDLSSRVFSLRPH